MMFLIVTYKKLRTNDIVPEMEDFNKCKFAFMAFLDVIHVTMIMISGGIIPAPLTILLLQFSVPMTMMTSKLMLGNKYSWKHYVSSSLLLLGLVLHILPMLESVINGHTTPPSTPPSPSPHSPLLHSVAGNSTPPPNMVTTPTETGVLWNCLLFALACLPGALSNMYKEYALQTQPMDM